MYSITKRIELAGAHFLDLPYESKCQQVHGHNWIVDVTIEGGELTEFGMLADFTHIKNITHLLDHKFIVTENQLDLMKVGSPAAPIQKLLHKSLVALPVLNTTAECMAEYLFTMLNKCICQDEHKTGAVTKVTIQESEGNVACFTL